MVDKYRFSEYSKAASSTARYRDGFTVFKGKF